MLQQGNAFVGRTVRFGLVAVAVSAAVYAAKGAGYLADSAATLVPREAVEVPSVQGNVPGSPIFTDQGARRVVSKGNDTDNTVLAAGPRPPREKSMFRAMAMQFKQGRQNAFFNESAFIQTFIQGGTQNVTALRDELLKADDLDDLSPDTDFMQDRPEVALERMAMVDLLIDAAKTDGEALDALVDLLIMPLDSALSEVAKKELVGEKFDLLVALVQMDQQIALRAYSELSSPGIKALLRPALLKGLFETGITVETAEDMIANL